MIQPHPLAYEFVDVEYARKFSDEERIGRLASFFAALAIFISCLGIFGLAEFRGGAAHQGNWCAQSNGRQCGEPLGHALERLCGAGGHLPAAGHAPGVVFHEQLADELFIPKHHDLVDLCRSRRGRIAHYFANSELPVYQGRSCQPG
jgi:hypothetical protein